MNNWKRDLKQSLAVEATTLFEATPASLCLLDESGRCQAATASFARGLGTTAVALAGTVPTLPADAEIRPLRLTDGGQAHLVTLVRPADDPMPALLRHLFDELPVAISVTDLEHRYRFMNRYWARQLGVSPDHATGRTDEELVGHQHCLLVAAPGPASAEDTGVGPLVEQRCAGVDGVIRDWLVALVPLHRPDGAVDSVARIAIDISGRRRLEDALTVMRRDVQDADRLRTRFLTLVGSELRAPLNAIIGFSEFLVEQSLGPLGHRAYVEFAADVLKAGRHLLELINDTVDMARLQSGGLVLAEETIDLQRSIELCLRMMSLPARHRGLEMTCRLPPGLPALVADQRRLHQVVGNLLSNAIKFTRPGGLVTVSARIEATGELALAVTDTGIGIADKDIAIALAPFGRIEIGPAGREEGTGLGLPLAKALIEAHGGRLELVSEVGHGTEVRMIFPAGRLRYQA